MPSSLELPPTIRPPRPDEVPQNSTVSDRLALRPQANIVEGFTIVPKENRPDLAALAFNFYAEINVNNSRLWEVFLALCQAFPEQAALIFSAYDDAPTYGAYTDKAHVLDVLHSYKKEVVADAFIELGLIFHTDELFVELFLTESKYLKFWGVDAAAFRATMQDFGLEAVEGLEFVDEYPKVREPLRIFDATVTDPATLMDHLNIEFVSHPS